MDFDKVIKERHSVRSFKKGTKIDYKKLIEIIDAGRNAPMAGNTPCIRFILISEKDRIRQLAEAAQQPFVADVDWVIAVCSDKNFLIKTYLDQTEKYVRQEAGAAIENMLLKAVDLGFSSCWVGAFAENMVKRILRVPDSVDVEALLPIGKELGKPRKKGKPDMDSLLFFNEWKNKFLDYRKVMPASTST